MSSTVVGVFCEGLGKAFLAEQEVGFVGGVGELGGGFRISTG